MAGGAPTSCGDEKSISPASSIFCNIFYLLTDLVFYSALAPVLGNYISGCLVKTCCLPPIAELLLTISITYALVNCAFVLLGERLYWKHLFAFDSSCTTLLWVRDILNSITFVTTFAFLTFTVEDMIADKSMKKDNLSEGSGYFFVKTLFASFNVDQTVLQGIFGQKLPHTGSIVDPDFGENRRFVLAGAFMLYWAVLSSCVAKLLYFNQLFTYVRAMEIFISLNPIFPEDDDIEEEVKQDDEEITDYGCGYVNMVK